MPRVRAREKANEKENVDGKGNVFFFNASPSIEMKEEENSPFLLLSSSLQILPLSLSLSPSLSLSLPLSPSLSQSTPLLELVVRDQQVPVLEPEDQRRLPLKGAELEL